MTIDNETTRNQYDGDGAVTAFGFSFQVQSASDVLVILRDAAKDDNLRVLDTHYTVTLFDGGTNGGEVEMITAPAVGEILTNILNPQLTQTSDFSSGGTILPQSVEDSLDNSTNIDKRSRDLAIRSLVLNDGGPTTLDNTFNAKFNRISNLQDAIDGPDAANLATVRAEILTAALPDFSQIVTAAGVLVISQLTTQDMLAVMDYDNRKTNSVLRSNEDKLGDVLSVRDFGALGDGINDDTFAIQSAFNAAALSTNDRMVFFPAGLYQITGKLDIPKGHDGMKFRGEGSELTVIRTSHSTEAVFNGQLGAGEYLFYEFEGMTLKANNNATRTVGFAMMDLRGVWRHLIIRDVVMRDHTDGINIDGPYNCILERVVISDPSTLAGGIGLTVGKRTVLSATEGDFVTIRDCTIVGDGLEYVGVPVTQKSLHSIVIYDANHVHMTNCEVGGTTSDCVVIDPAFVSINHKFSGNRFGTTDDGNCLLMHSSTVESTPPQIQGCQVSDNLFAGANGGAAGDFTGAGLSMRTAAGAITLAGGELTRVANTATISHAAHGYLVGEQIHITGASQFGYNGSYLVATVPDVNTLTFTMDSTPPASPATGTIVMHKEGCSFARNSFSNNRYQFCDGPGIYLQGPNDSQFSGERVNDNGGGGGDHDTGVWIDTGFVTGPTFDGLLTTNNSAGGVKIEDSATACLVSGGRLSETLALVWNDATSKLSEICQHFGNVSMPQLDVDIAVTGVHLPIPPTTKLVIVTSTGNIETIADTYDGHVVTLRLRNTTTVDSGAGNVLLAGDFTAGADNSALTIRYDAGSWYEVGRSSFSA